MLLPNHIMRGALAKCFVLAGLFLLLGTGMAQAAAGDWQSNPQLRVRLISAVDGTGDRAAIPLGLEVQLAPGWKTYWRMPGDAGAPPQLDWPADTNPNLAQINFEFPAPTRHSVAGLETIGYQDHIVFPLSVTPKQIGGALPLQAKLTILSCAEQCIPNDFMLQLTVPAGTATPSTEASLIETAQAQVPLHDQLTLSAAQQDANGKITLHFTAPTALQGPDAFIESAEGSLFKAPHITLEPERQGGIIELTPFTDTAHSAPLQLTVTLVDSGKGWDGNISVPPPVGMPIALHPDNSLVTPPVVAPPPLIDPSAAAPNAVPLSLWVMLWFAFLGGLILNLMPCVLPVLSLKILKFMGHGGKENADARRSFLVTSLGILCCFWLIAGGLLLLRAAGASIGWGIQFQHPAFLLFLSGVLLVFAANLWGLFEFKLPDKLNQRLGNASGHPKLLGDFLSGIFAALLATPCTAPFLGTAVGFALASNNLTTLAIFSGMGLGMATPFLLVAALPMLATKMPRPGKWMMTLRRVLALCLVGAALWFGSVLADQAFPPARDARWQPFAPERIAGLVDSGQVVFVDVTASWCINCQANKKFVLYQPDIVAHLFDGKVVAMQADWTRPDPQIAAYLKNFNRAGIPFNVVYGPGAPQGIVLPELLTQEAVLGALDKAAGK